MATDPAPEHGPAGWRPDPLGHHEFRWWDGRNWTDRVAGHDVHAGETVGSVEEHADEMPFDALKPAQRSWREADLKAYADPDRFRQAFGRVTLPDDHLQVWAVAGEGDHQDALDQVAGPKTEDGVWVETVAELRPEPDHPDDPGAVAVLIHDHQVGYLARRHATERRDLIDRAAVEHGEATCGAVINGGWDRPDGGPPGSYGVRLYVGVPEDQL